MSTSTASRIGEIQAMGVAGVAARLGLVARHAGSLSPCLACDAVARSEGDRRGPLGITDNGAGWCCHRCKASGDAVDLLTTAVLGVRASGVVDWSPVWAWLDGPDGRRPIAPPAPRAERELPAGEVLALWEACIPVTEAEPVRVWLASRGLSAQVVAAKDLARALPPEGELPRWAWCRGASWRASGHLLILPLWDAHGMLRSLRARAVRDAEIKALAPAGSSIKGLCLANGGARAALEGHPERVGQLGLIVVEGEPDYLSWGHVSLVRPVIGLVSGSWDQRLAEQIPAGARVWLRTHNDEAGDKYARAAARTLEGREVLRLQGPADKDDNDRWRAGELGDPGAGCPPPPGGEGAAPPAGDAPRIRDPLDAWRVEQGQVVEARWQGDQERLELRFRGTIRVAREEVQLEEDPEAPGGWAETRRVTYRIERPGMPPIERLAEGTRSDFQRLIEGELASANRCRTLGQLGSLYQHVASQGAVTSVRSRHALGHHATLGGWVTPPGVLVSRGVIGRTEEEIRAPGQLLELRRYRLLELGRADLARVAAWVVSDLARVDHAEQGYALPVMGTILGAPLWSYVPRLASWQRYALFVQGSSGTGKTYLVRALMCLWGDFYGTDDIPTWLSSATHLEDLLHTASGVPVHVADFKRAQMTREQRQAAMGIVQAYADRASRGRGTTVGRAMRKRPPRCQLVIDGEDLPEGQQSTLGRLLILPVTASGGSGRCATTDTLDPAMLRLLPGLTAAWIAHVQREADTLDAHLVQVLRGLDQDLGDAPATTNRSRVLRNYAVQVTTLTAFARWLAELGAPGAVELGQRAPEVHLDLARRQLGCVGEEGAAEQVWDCLCQLLQSGAAFLRPANDHAGPQPFKGSAQAGGTCVGTYDHEDHATLWPDVVLGLVQGQLTRGGGDRVDFSRRAIADQLGEHGLIEPNVRVWVSGRQVRAWRTTVPNLGGEPQVKQPEYRYPAVPRQVPRQVPACVPAP